ncbi:hypothetical protein K470DRAFT_199761, partial [Piedraia hortae CBS 480.64]
RFNFDITPETSADERSRSRSGYNGFNRQSPVCPARIDRQPARRSRDYGAWSTSRSRSRGPMGTQAEEEIIKYISHQWSFMAQENCIPIKVALQLMDSSSLGLEDQYGRFEEAHEQLQNALKSIVNEHHQGFNSSIGTFHKIQAAILASQQRVRTLKTGLGQAKGSLGTAKPELRTFAGNSQTYDAMLQVLSDIEHLQAVPEKLEAQVGEKRFLGAVETLQEALVLIRKPEMEDIGALSDLRVYLGNQEHSLSGILIEELHSHLYLKSPYCETSTQDLGGVAAQGMRDFLDQYDGAPMQEDLSGNPEANTFEYIQLLIESLNNFGKLDSAVEAIDQRMPVELFKVVERSHGEVEQRHPTASRTRQKTMVPDEEQTAVLQDLLLTLYAKFEAIAEAHRVFYNVTMAILKREGQGKEDTARLSRNFRELWQVFQSEIRSLLHDHLAPGGESDGQRKDSHVSAHVFRPQARDKTRRLFRLTDIDPKSADFASEKEDLESILKTSVPGLVNKDSGHTICYREDEMAHDKSGTGHKLLVEPSVFNMAILLPPTLTFLKRLKSIVPPSAPGLAPNGLTIFLGDFLLNVFYPQLEETLQELCSAATSGGEAFRLHPEWPKYSSRPVLQGVVRFFDIIQRVSTLLSALPHEQSFSTLVLDQIVAYREKCSLWWTGMVARPKGVKLAAELAHEGELAECAQARINGQADTQREASLLISLELERGIDDADLLSDPKSLVAICMLTVSIRWLIAKLRELRYISPKAIEAELGGAWLSTSNIDVAAMARLPLNERTAREMDAIQLSLTQLQENLLRVLYFEMRIFLLHGIYSSMTRSYQLGQPYNDPDPRILQLAEGLSSLTSLLSTHLLQTQYALLASDLDTLADQALIAFSPKIQGMDVFGQERMALNIAVLKQSLKSLGGGNLGKADEFWALGRKGCESVWREGENLGVKKAELKALMALSWIPERDAADGS